MTEPAASPRYGPQVVEAMRSVLEAMYQLCLFRNVHFRAFVDKHEVTHGEALFDSVGLLLSYPPRDIRSGHEDGNYHREVLTLKNFAEEVAFFERMMKPGAYGHPFYSA